MKKGTEKRSKEKWGFLRETKEAAQKAGIDKATGLVRTGLDEYLKVIFPQDNNWIHYVRQYISMVHRIALPTCPRPYLSAMR